MDVELDRENDRSYNPPQPPESVELINLNEEGEWSKQCSCVGLLSAPRQVEEDLRAVGHGNHIHS